MSKRTFKVMELGLSYGRSHAKGAELRFRGQWLRKLGFHPGAFLVAESPEPGVLQLRITQPAQGTATEFVAALAPFQKLGI